MPPAPNAAASLGRREGLRSNETPAKPTYGLKADLFFAAYERRASFRADESFEIWFIIT